MLVNVEVDSGLTDDTVLYRIVDFYSAATLVSSNKFFFSRADTFIDKNEAVFISLASVFESGKNLGCSDGFVELGEKDVEGQHDRFKRSHYISCWTRNADSVALWSLYSPDHCGVRIAVSVRSLKTVLKQFANRFDFDRLSERDIGSNAIVSVNAMIAEVNYVSLESILRKATKRAYAVKRLFARNPEALQMFPAKSTSALQKEKAARIRNVFAEEKRFATYKDISFKHEDEVRLILQVGENEVTPTLLSWQEVHVKDPERKVPRMMLSRSVGKHVTPPFESVEFPGSEVISFCIDPRCPPHKRDFIENFFRENSCQIVASSSFGYLPKKFSVFPVRPA